MSIKPLLLLLASLGEPLEKGQPRVRVGVGGRRRGRARVREG